MTAVAAASFTNVSVVRIASAASDPSAERAGTSISMPCLIAAISRGTPMTPVEET